MNEEDSLVQPSMSERENDASSLTSPCPRRTARQEELGSNSLTNKKHFNTHRASIAFIPHLKEGAL
jgi:hypothetical protein